MKSLVFSKSSTSIVAVAFDVPPVIVSPAINLPPESSDTILLPLSSKRNDSVSSSRSKLLII